VGLTTASPAGIIGPTLSTQERRQPGREHPPRHRDRADNRRLTP
jgi:hypothetical protein